MGAQLRKTRFLLSLLLSLFWCLTAAQTHSWVLEEYTAEQVNATHPLLIRTIIQDSSEKSLHKPWVYCKLLLSLRTGRWQADRLDEPQLGPLGSEGERSRPRGDLTQQCRPPLRESCLYQSCGVCIKSCLFSNPKLAHRFIHLTAFPCCSSSLPGVWNKFQEILINCTHYQGWCDLVLITVYVTWNCPDSVHTASR